MSGGAGVTRPARRPAPNIGPAVGAIVFGFVLSYNLAWPFHEGFGPYEFDNVGIITRGSIYVGILLTVIALIKKRVWVAITVAGLTYLWMMQLHIPMQISHLWQPKLNISGYFVDNIGPSSSAAKFGVKEGDVIQSINGHAISSQADLQQVLKNSPTSSFDFAVVRGGQNITLHITRPQ